MTEQITTTKESCLVCGSPLGGNYILAQPLHGLYKDQSVKVDKVECSIKLGEM